MGERWEFFADLFHRLLASESRHHVARNPGALDNWPLLVVVGIDPLAHGLQSLEPALEILVDAREIEYHLAKRNTVRVCRPAPYGLIQAPAPPKRFGVAPSVLAKAQLGVTSDTAPVRQVGFTRGRLSDQPQ